MTAGRILRPTEAAVRLGVAVQTLARWRCEGQGPAFRKLGLRMVGYDEAALVAWLSERGATSTVQAREKIRPAA